MKFKLTEKIEEIRSKPEHIRLRWVWAGVAVSMLLIFVIWIFSISLMFKKGNNGSNNGLGIVTEIKNQAKQIPQSVTSLQNYVENKPLSLDSEGIAPAQKESAQNAGNQEFQSAAYKDLEGSN